MFVVSAFLEIKLSKSGLSLRTYLEWYFLADMIGNILSSTATFLVAYMFLKLNKPLMTRRDLSSGEEVSMLMFIKSKQQMRNIFDPDTEIKVSFINES